MKKRAEMKKIFMIFGLLFFLIILGFATAIRLEVQSGSSPLIRIQDTSQNGKTYHVGVASSDGTLRIAESGIGDRLTITPGQGYVGIGTTTPLRNLHVFSSSNPTIWVGKDDSDGRLSLFWNTQTNSALVNSFRSNTFAGLQIDGKPLLLNTLSGSGNVGIGVANPGEKLEINGNVKITGLAGAGDRQLCASPSGVIVICS